LKQFQFIKSGKPNTLVYMNREVTVSLNDADDTNVSVDPSRPPAHVNSSYAWPALRTTLTSFLATRIVVSCSAWASVNHLLIIHPHSFYRGPFTTAALMWDGVWYAGIAQYGYAQPPTPGDINVAFPPLLPLLARLLGSVFSFLGIAVDDPKSGSVALAGVVISNIAFFVALYALWHLVVLDHPQAVAGWTLWLVAAFPLGIFWSAFYAESLFLVLSVTCLLAARRGLWGWAGVLGGLAALTRWPGMLLVVVLLVELISARRETAVRVSSTTPRILSSLAAIGLIPLSLLGHMLFLKATVGHALGMLSSHAQGWHETLSFFPVTYAESVSSLWLRVSQTGPTKTILSMLTPRPEQTTGNILYLWLDLGLPLLFAGLGLLGWRRGWLRPSDLVWLGSGIVFALSWSTTLSVARYMMPLWPALVVAARLCAGRPMLGRLYLIGAGVLLALTAYLFAGAKWVG
jgi:hypothetical protein